MLHVRGNASTSSQGHEPSFYGAANRIVLSIVPAHGAEGEVHEELLWRTSILKSGSQVVEKWKNIITDSSDGGIILVNKWLARSALDIIGEGTPCWLLSQTAMSVSFVLFVSLQRPSTSSTALWTKAKEVRSPRPTTICCKSHALCDQRREG